MNSSPPHAPQLSKRLLPRPRLTPLFDEAMRRSLVVVKGGPGLGKTEAVADYLRRHAYRTLWFHCEASDNLTAPFFKHFLRLVAPHRPALAKRLAARGFPDSEPAFAAFLADITAELYRDDQSLAFVFDDLHLITAPPILGFLFRFMSMRLENITFVIISRSWPLFPDPFPITPRIITGESLAFSPAETAEYFKRLGLELEPEREAALHRYLAGWPIALSLVALALTRQDQALPLESFLSRAKPALFELFDLEIFSQYTPKEQDLLVVLSALDSFPRGLVTAVTGEDKRELSQLLGGNPFIVYDADARRLSYHPLYREFLAEKRLLLPQAELDEAFEKAGSWCLAAGHYYDACRYFAACGDHEQLWAALLAIDGTRHARSEADFFIEQISSLPESFRHAHPLTQIVLATMLINNLRLAEAEAVLAGVHESLTSAASKQRELWGEYYIARGFLILAREENGFELAFEKAATLLPQGSRRYRQKIRLVDLGPGLNLQHNEPGELEKSLACFVRAVPFMIKTLHGAGGGLDELCLCEAAFLTGDIKKATNHAYEALYNAEAHSQYDIVGNALFILLRIYTLQGDYPSLVDTLEHVERYRTVAEAACLGIWDVIQSWFYADMGELGKIPTWIRNPVQKGFSPLSVDRAILVRLRALIAAGQYSETLALLTQFEKLAAGKSAVIASLYLEINRSVTLYYLRRQDEAVAALEKAYEQAVGNSLIMPFIESGSRTRSLLDYARKNDGHKIPRSWLDDIHARANTAAKRYATISGRYRLEQPGGRRDFDLSRRETELMMNLSQGLTREEIAASMELSSNTVKSLTKQTFAKLGAINAADAVRIAILNQLI